MIKGFLNWISGRSGGQATDQTAADTALTSVRPTLAQQNGRAPAAPVRLHDVRLKDRSGRDCHNPPRPGIDGMRRDDRSFGRNNHGRAMNRQCGETINRRNGVIDLPPHQCIVNVGKAERITGSVSNPTRGLTVLEYQTFTLNNKELRPVDALARKTQDGKMEIVFCDIAARKVFAFDASNESGEEVRSLVPLEKPDILGSLAKPSSVAITMDGKKFGIKDDTGVHFFDAESKEFLTSTTSLMSIFGLEVYNKNFFVTIDNSGPSLIFIDSDMEEMINRRVNLNQIPREAEATIDQHHDARPRSSGFRFLAVERTERNGKKRAAVTDWGLHRIHVVNLSTGGEIEFSIGGYGYKEGQFRDPAGALFLPNGNLAVADSKNGRIQTFGPDGSHQGLIHLPQTVTRPVGLFLQEDVDEDDGKKLHLVVTHYNPLPGITKLTLQIDE